MKHTHIKKLVRRSETFRFALFHSQIGFLLCASILLVLISSTITYGWIAKNNRTDYHSVTMTYDVDDLRFGGVKLDDDNTATIVDPDAAITSSTLDEFLIPGSTLTMYIGITNASGSKTVKSLGFENAAIWQQTDGNYSSVNVDAYDEIPTEVKVDDNYYYYYLGTQLTIKSEQYSIYNYEEKGVDQNGFPILSISSAGENTVNQPLSAMTPVYMTTVDGGTASANSTIRGDLDISLGAGQLIVFKIVIVFEDTGDEQNVYQNFGGEGSIAKFTRTLAINVD